jgi:hypothetical protein
VQITIYSSYLQTVGTETQTETETETETPFHETLFFAKNAHPENAHPSLLSLLQSSTRRSGPNRKHLAQP